MHCCTGLRIGAVLLFSWACDKRMTGHCCALEPSYCSPLSCDNRMINRSGDFIGYYLVLRLVLFVVQAYKSRASLSLFPHSSPFPFIILPILKSTCLLPTLPSHFRSRRTPAPKMLWNRWSRSGDLASLCLKKAHEIFLGD